MKMRSIFKKIRFFFHLGQAFLNKHLRLVFLSFLIGILSFWFFPKIVKVVPAKRGAQKVGMVGKFTVSQLPSEIQNLISSGLTSILPDGTATPSLASSWKVSEDGKVYAFTLKDELYWHDGSPIVANDINYNFSDVATAVLDSKTIEFRLKEPFSPFPAIVSKPVFKKGFIGTEKYKVASLKRNGQIVEEIVLKPKIKKSKEAYLVFRFYPTEEAARTAFKLGEIDSIKEISGLGDLEGWANIQISPEIKFNRYVAIFFNTQKDKLSDKSFRQAFAYALKKEWSPRALGPINPYSWAYNSSVKQYGFDLENAKKLLDKTFESKEKPETIEIELATVPSLLSIAEKVKDDWEKLQVVTNIKVINIIPEGFEALLVTQEVSPDPDQYALWHSTQGVSNLSRYKSPKVDMLLEEGRKTMNREERKQIYFDFQRFLVEDTPAIFLFHPTLYTISRR